MVPAVGNDVSRLKLFARDGQTEIVVPGRQIDGPVNAGERHAAAGSQKLAVRLAMDAGSDGSDGAVGEQHVHATRLITARMGRKQWWLLGFEE